MATPQIGTELTLTISGLYGAIEDADDSRLHKQGSVIILERAGEYKPQVTDALKEMFMTERRTGSVLVTTDTAESLLEAGKNAIRLGFVLATLHYALRISEFHAEILRILISNSEYGYIIGNAIGQILVTPENIAGFNLRHIETLAACAKEDPDPEKQGSLVRVFILMCLACPRVCSFGPKLADGSRMSVALWLKDFSPLESIKKDLENWCEIFKDKNIFMENQELIMLINRKLAIAYLITKYSSGASDAADVSATLPRPSTPRLK